MRSMMRVHVLRVTDRICASGVRAYAGERKLRSQQDEQDQQRSHPAHTGL